MTEKTLTPTRAFPSLWGERRRVDPFHAMQREMNRMFEDLWQGPDPTLMRTGNGGFAEMAPKVDVSETKKAVHVTAELPGMEEKDVEVTFADGLLTIAGEHKAEKEEKDEAKKYYVRECSYGSFRRVLPIGDTIDEKKVKATFKNGKLTVELPKSKEAKEKTRRIPISH